MSKRAEVSEATLNAYRMWHQKHPRKVRQVTYDFPVEIPVLGTALRIVYWSDKWEADNEGFLYEHDFDSRPMAYGAMHRGEPQGKHVDTAGLLRVEHVDDQMEFPILADVVELSVDVVGEGVKTFSFKTPPLLLCTKDKKGLVILHKKTPILIRGPHLRVTERGIVN